MSEERSKRPVRVATAVLVALIALVLAGCGGDDETTTTVTAVKLSEPEEIEQVGNEWAELFAKDDGAACDYIFAQPVCLRFVGGTGDPSVFQESFADATVERVEIKGHKARVEFSNGERVEFIQETQEPPEFLGDWFILEP
jgi:hypothetical protein